MGILNRLHRRVDRHEETTNLYEPRDEPIEAAEKSMGQLLERVLTYRDDEIRDLRAKLYETVERERRLLLESSTVKFERNEALQRVAKLLSILNKKQQAQIEKAPFDFAVSTVPVFGDKSRPITVPPLATMKTVQRKGSHGGEPLGMVVQADRKSFTERD